MMNCKKGDLAVIVAADTEYQHIGKIVLVSRPSNFFPGSWETEPMLRSVNGQLIDWRDSHLRPIRDTDGEDEMLRIAGKPQKKRKPVKA